MELGLFLSYQVNSDEHLDGLFGRMVEYAVRADESGFTRVWTPEHHLVQFLPSPSALLTAVHVGQHVRCRVGTAVVVLPFHQPVQLAGEISAADHALGGRLDLGVARGAYRYEFEKFGLPFQDSREHFIENLEAVERLLRTEDGPSSHSGRFASFDDVYVWPRPVQRPMPPVWMGVQHPAGVEDAARRGYDVLNSLFFWDDDHMRDVAGAFHRGKAQSGRDDTRLGVTRYAFLTQDGRETERRIENVLEGWRIHAQLHDFTQNADPLGRVLPAPQENEPTVDELRDRLFIGTRAEIEQKLRRYRDAGVDLINLNLVANASRESTLETITAFGSALRAVNGGTNGSPADGTAREEADGHVGHAPVR
ncbi:LLM class flavin-dependent oxidoreductase [Streptomyces sp. NPDC052077]|uniref:LLM class flavin-dependent oxidoreductase n=1 Tax=Streptomyces sp. NPDC052077 TaxID=3154757 RepID=UPI003427943C